jgi:phospholipid/cholesterol/gamma-HCH transport system substrate-binding protein
MRRALLIAGLLLAAAIVVALGTGASGDGGSTYQVRAIFDNAGFLVTGEDVKVAGVKIGTVVALDVTPDRKAAIVLRIDDPAFQDFRQDAACQIRLQSLIGEKFVACQPTQPHDANAQLPPPLRKIRRGAGAGQYLLPVTNTSSPVDVDLLSDIMRVPQRQRFAIILNELGVGLAGNGAQLRAVIRRADPALQQFDRVLAILASQNRVLANLASESDAALAPVAAQSARVSDFINTAGQTAQATAERGDALEQNFAKLPAFLTQLRPTARRLGEFASAATPVFANLRAVAPSIDTIFQQLGPFGTAAIPAFRTLGNAADIGRRALPAAQPVIRDLGALGSAARPLAANLASALTKLDRQHGIERLLQIILFTTGATNGFNAVSHYLRAYLFIPGTCLSYQTIPSPSCTATLTPPATSSATSAAASSSIGAASSMGPNMSTGISGAKQIPTAATPRAAQPSSSGGSSASSTSAASGLLGYLLGNGGGR